MRFLLFTLYAPVGSLGEIAVGERRLSWARPSRSAVLGLVAAALGIERSDDAGHRTLEDGLYYAVRTDASGTPFVDYQTAQTPKARKGQRFVTRRDELGVGSLHTILSSREWRSDACYTVALWPRQVDFIDLDEVVQALYKPSFSLYLGRKAAPLGLPLDPEIVEAETFMAAFAGRRFSEIEEEILRVIRRDTPYRSEIAFDGDAPDSPSEVRIERRRDVVVSRTRWQFTNRVEGIVATEESNQ